MALTFYDLLSFFLSFFFFFFLLSFFFSFFLSFFHISVLSFFMSLRYYVFRVDDPLASISIKLQCFNKGDADLYVGVLNTNSTLFLPHPSSAAGVLLDTDSDTDINININMDMDMNPDTHDGAKDKSKPFALPTKESSTWHSSAFGGDTVLIQYYDPNFCSHCSYVVGVRGFYNTSYSIVASASKDAISRLVVSNYPSCLPVCFCVCLSVCASVSVCLSVCASVCASVSVCVSVCL